ncbi:MAG: formylglycine-generating enzyme family protein [Pirellulales bacterium]
MRNCKLLCWTVIGMACGWAGAARAEEGAAAAGPVPLASVERLQVPDSDAKSEGEMKPYTELIEHTDAKIDLVPIRGGKFMMGSPESEANRRPDEGPQHEVEIEPFWMGKFETGWEAYEVWMFDLDRQRRDLRKQQPNVRDKAADEYQLSQPTPPYTDMSFGWGKKGYPAICMTQLAARTYCNWLSMKTGRFYRLPTEAEWEYACRAGTTTAYSFGDDPAQLGDYGWYYDNSEEKYNKVGQKKPNPWGLYDMHGNVSEWVLDQYVPDFYQQFVGKTTRNPLAIPTTEYPRVVRGGSWYDDAESLRSAARKGSTPDWKKQDPQVPQSMWYFTDATFVGFRIVRPLNEPTEEEKKAIWDNSLPEFNRKAGRR